MQRCENLKEARVKVGVRVGWGFLRSLDPTYSNEHCRVVKAFLRFSEAQSNQENTKNMRLIGESSGARTQCNSMRSQVNRYGWMLF